MADQNSEFSFSFGKNWEDFVDKKFNFKRMQISKKWMLDFLKVMNIPVMILSKDSNKNQIVNFAKKQKNQGITTALILKKGVIE